MFFALAALCVVAAPTGARASGPITSATIWGDTFDNYIWNPFGSSTTSVTIDHGTIIVHPTFPDLFIYTPPRGFTGRATGTYRFGPEAGDVGPIWITVQAPVALGVHNPGPIQATARQPYSFGIWVYGGAGRYAVSLENGSLPPGLVLGGDGTISGTPTTLGPYSFTVKAVDGYGQTARGAFTLTVVPPVIAMPSLPDGMAYVAYDQSLNANGGSAPYAYERVGGSLPPGLTLGSGGRIQGVPIATGSYGFDVKVTDAYGFTGQRSLAINIATPTIRLDPASPASGTAHTPYDHVFAASGGTAPYSFRAAPGDLPPGLTLDAGGRLSGAPTSPGRYVFDMTATDLHGFEGRQGFTVEIAAPSIVVAPAAPPTGVVYQAYRHAFSASGGAEPYRFRLAGGDLPPGLDLEPDGLLTGTPTRDGRYRFDLVARDSTVTGAVDSAPVGYEIEIAAPTLTLDGGALPGGLARTAYDHTLSARGGKAPYAFNIESGDLPAGVILSADGRLAGTPATAGAYAFRIKAVDAGGYAVSADYALAIGEPAPVAVPDSASTPANQPVAIAVATNDVGVVDSVAVTSLPSRGTHAVSGADIVYTPEADFFGEDSLEYVATGPGGTSAPTRVTITVSPLPVPSAPNQIVVLRSDGEASIDAFANATGAPRSVVLATAPSHGTAVLSGATITYRPASDFAGEDRLTYVLSNPFGDSAPVVVDITVNPAPVVGAPLSAEILAGQTATVDLTAGARGGPFNGASLVGLSPADAGEVRIEAQGGGWNLIFRPDDAFAGEVVATYTLANAHGDSAPGTVRIVVTARPDPSRDPEVVGLLGAQADAARRFASAQVSNIGGRLEALRAGRGRAEGLSGLRLSGQARDFVDGYSGLDTARLVEIGVIRSSESSGAERAARPFDAAPGEAGPFGLWAAGVVDFGRSDGEASRKGVRFSTDGLTVGADYRLDDRWVVGLAAGWGHDRSRVGDNGTRSRADGYSVAVYGGFVSGDAVFVDGILGYGGLDFRSRRHVEALDVFAVGGRDGNQWFGALTAGRGVTAGAWSFAPYGRLEAGRATLAAFAETGAGAYDLAFEAQTVETLTGVAGLSASYRRASSIGVVVPRLRLEYGHAFRGAGQARLSYVDWVGGPSYGAYIAPFARDSALLGLGVDLIGAGGLRSGVEYEAEMSDGAARGRLRVNLQGAF